MILDRKVARSDDNDRDLVPDRMLLHLCHELKSVHLWHHQIENDDVRNAFPEPVEGETPILGLDQQPPLGFQPGANAHHRFRSTFCATAHHEKYTEKRILAVKVTRNSIEATSTT